MESTADRAIAIVGVGAVLPDAPNVASFWTNIKNGRYSISEVMPDRWDPAFYFDPDHAAPDKTYSKIGGWVRDHVWDPMKWRLAIPPRVVSAMDESQKWAISCTREALEDYGYPARPLNIDRTAVILGNAMAGEKHYFTALRLYFPEYAHELAESTSFAALPPDMRDKITRELHDRMTRRVQEVTEDTMPGELSNCIAGRIANTFNFHGPNYVVDAACASAMAAFQASVEGLIERAFDVAVTGGIDRNMGASTYIKFCKVGALSATGTRPYAEGADGFVMGEGSAIFILKRLGDAERDGDKIYAVLRGIAGSSDGKGKGITAPNPIGQKLSVERAWDNAGLSPATATYIEGHGTSTRVGDVVEVESMAEVLAKHNAAQASVALGSVKSNIGHLKAAAGAAGLLKAALALRDKVIPPSVHCDRRNPDIDFAHLPLYVNTELKAWEVPADTPRRAGVSAFGFGGTNFHVVLEEHLPHKLNGNGKRSVAVGEIPAAVAPEVIMNAQTSANVPSSYKAPLRGAMVVGASSVSELIERLRSVQKSTAAGMVPGAAAPSDADLRAPERLAIDYADATELADRIAKAIKALATDQVPVWKALRAQGIYRGHGPAPKVAFLYTGQGSQYVNMLRPLLTAEPIVKQTFEEADRVMTPLLGKPLTDFIFVDKSDSEAVAKAEDDLRQTAITQPAVLATDEALTRLLAAYGIRPDMTMGHSLGEYGALVASGAIPFNDALEAVSARGRGMTSVAMNDNGKMAAIIAPMTEVESILKGIDGYVVIANINSNSQAVIGGASKAVEQAMDAFRAAGYDPVELPVSHAFHTSIVAGAGVPLRKELERLHFRSPIIPIVANVNGQFYPMGPDVVPQMHDILTQQVAAPVQFVKGLHTLYEAGARVFVEVGPKKALQGFAEDVLGKDSTVLSIFTNHPKTGDIVSFNQALCALYAAGFGNGQPASASLTSTFTSAASRAKLPETSASTAPLGSGNGKPSAVSTLDAGKTFNQKTVLEEIPKTPARPTPVVITGAAIGLPGTEHIFDDTNVARILRGDQFIDTIPTRFRRGMLDKNITRLVKSEDGAPSFETIHDMAEVIKLAARGGAFDPEAELGISPDRLAALDQVTRLAIGAGIDAMRDAGIPLVMRYKTTTKGTQLPDRWALPDALRDDTGVIFGSAFPGYDSYADEMSRYYTDRARREQLQTLQSVRERIIASNGNNTLAQELDRRIAELRTTIEKEPYVFNRRFLFRVLSMGHSQFAEFIGARGPNTQLNSACATTTQAVSLAEDWIHAGRCRRVIVISADDITSDHTLEWFGAGFLASGAAATDELVEEAAIPFDRRRHGLIIGMGAAALVVESAEAAADRGVTPICEVLSSVTANSAFHGTRLDVQHICQIMETVIAQAEARYSISRRDIAPRTVFVSHETYTPARGGSASAEIHALRRVFGDVADQIVIANTKGFTGHAMATGIEDVVAVKSLETSCVPPVANFKEVDPELGPLNLSKGGIYPVEYALRLGAGFGSQISMTLMRWVKSKDGTHRTPNALGYSYRIADADTWTTWLQTITGQKAADLEIVHRTLRVKDQAPHVVPPPTEKEIALSSPRKIEPAISAVPISAPATPQPAVAVISSDDHKDDSVKERVLALVAEKTGYPPDMLDLDLDLEADLGVDTVKQAEVFAAVREAYGIARDDQIKLRDFPTLAHVIRFVHDRRPDVKAKAFTATVAPLTSKEATSATPPVVANDESVKERILSLVVEKTGYPKDMLDLDLDLEADLGVDTVKQAEMFAAIRAAYDIPRDENLKLRDYPTLAHVIRFVYDKRPDLTITSEVHPTVETPAPTRVPVTVPALPGDSIKEKVLVIVAEKTGYPQDMLDLDLDLEADLGVDTVKQAEMFAAIRAIYNIPRDENLKLRDYPTLAHVIKFVTDKRPELAETRAVQPVASTAAPAPVPIAIPAASQKSSGAGDLIKEKVLEIVAEKTGYPQDMLDLELDLEADLGVDTVKQAEMFAAIRAIYNIPRDENLKLRDYPTLAHVIRFVNDKRPDLSAVLPPISQTLPTPSITSSVPSKDSIKAKVLAIVAEKTGYPPEMLDLDLDLEADLGVDTVKQAEMFAAVRAAYNIPRDENLKLRDFPTLAHVIRFAQDRQPNAAAPPITTTEVASPEKNATPSSVAKPRLASFNAVDLIPRRVPVPVLRPPITLCKSTGVTLASGSRVVIMPDKGGINEVLIQRLQSLGVETLRLNPSLDPDALMAQLTSWLAAGPIRGVYWLPALDPEGSLRQMDFAAWRENIRIRVKSLYLSMRTLYEQVALAGTFLVSATRLGGQHGYDQTGAIAPMGGAVTGFTKAYKRERMDALVKAVDFEVDRNKEEIAALLIDETLRDTGAVEIGYKNGLRWTIALQEEACTNGHPGLTLNRDSVFLITGAAGSIVSAITADLAAASGGTFYLLDMVPEPNPKNPDLDRFRTDKEGLKRDLFLRIQNRGERATPALVEKELAALERAQAACMAIDAVRKAGGTPLYFSVNLTDSEAVAKVIDQVRQRSGRLDVLLHAAGIERSHILPDKDSREFDLVFDVKSDGWFNLLHAIGDMPLGATVAFSSIAGRFGNGGQTDYSSANDLLCKITSSFCTTRPNTRGIVIDWTAWGGIGMATRGSIPKMMELAGIDMLPPEAGIPFIRRELTTGSRSGEVLVGQRLGALLKDFDSVGGLDFSVLEKQTPQSGPMLGMIRAMTLAHGLSIETTLSPKEQPFLHDHQIDGTAVLPGVMGVEAFVEAALCMTPGWNVAYIEDVNFLAPFKFYRNEPRTLTINTLLRAEKDAVVAEGRLIGVRTLPNQSEPQITTHFAARVRVDKQRESNVAPSTFSRPSGAPIQARDIYRLYFHGPAYQVLERAWWDGTRIIGLLNSKLPENHTPSQRPLAAAPRLIELCFQTAGLWEMGVQGRMGLPQHVDQIQIFRSPEQAQSALYAYVTPNPLRGTFDAEVLDARGNQYVQLRGYRTVALQGAVDPRHLKALQEAMSLEAAVA